MKNMFFWRDLKNTFFVSFEKDYFLFRIFVFFKAFHLSVRL